MSSEARFDDVHGYDRGPELLKAIEQGTATVVEQRSHYWLCNNVRFFGHTQC
jgi:hypothetical protein